ncbi:MAG: NAD(P)H-dependent oxidoreductase [Planctomycetota bacterium]
MQLIEDLQWRYATKAFDPQQVVPEETVQHLLQATNLAATSYGLQPFRFVLIRDQELQDKLITSSYGQRQVADASHVIVIAIRTDVDGDYISSYVDFTEAERNMDPGALDGFKKMMIGTVGAMTDQSKATWASKQAYIALGFLLTACAAAKVDACPMEGFVASEYDEMLNLTSQNLSACVVIPIGYRSSEDKYSDTKKVRRPLDEMVIQIRNSD